MEDELLCLASCYAAPIRCACVAGVAEVWSRVSGTVGRVLGGSLASPTTGFSSASLPSGQRRL